MILTSDTQHASLAPFLHARALAATSRRLMLDLVAGALILAGACWMRPAGWVMLASAGLCFAAYGAWAFAERRLDTGIHPLPRLVDIGWSTLRAIAAVAGFGALLVLSFTVLSLLLGQWIS